MKAFHALDPDHVALGSQGRELDERAIRFHNLPDLIQPGQKNIINLGRRHNSILHEQSNAANEFVYLPLRHGNVLRRVSGDEDLLRVSTLGSSRAVSVDLRKGRWEVDSRVRCRLDKLDILP